MVYLCMKKYPNFSDFIFSIMKNLGYSEDEIKIEQVLWKLEQDYNVGVDNLIKKIEERVKTLQK